MTKQEAIQWMEFGARCKHKYFSTGEWVTIKEDGTYLFEDGVECSEEEFWSQRTESYWNIGWDFAKGWDPFVCIAAKQHKCSLEKVTLEMRSKWKAILFGLSYGMRTL